MEHSDSVSLVRPIELTQAVADEICERIADGESLRTICGNDHMPQRARVFRWLDDPANKAFSDQYARAREASADADADDIGHYSRQAADGKIEPAAARAAIDGLKWSAGKRKPKKYGDKLALVGGGKDDSPIRHQVDLSGLTDEELATLEAIRGKLAIPGGDQGGAGAEDEGG
jgi:hypothetical protein